MEPAIVTLFRHNLWANEALIRYCSESGRGVLMAEAPGGFGPVHRTLWHIIANEEGYLATVTGEPTTDPLFERQTVPDLPELADRARETGALLIQLISALDPDERVIGMWQGQPNDMPASVPLLQAINHGTEHRGHIRSALSVNGFQAPDIDMWHYPVEEGG
jgi:uncharacterized damage-inducible protein DinB